MHPSQFKNPRRHGNNLDGRKPDSQKFCKISKGTTQNSVNMNKQEHKMMPKHVTQSIANLNTQTHNMIPNAVPQLPQWFVNNNELLIRKINVLYLLGILK